MAARIANGLIGAAGRNIARPRYEIAGLEGPDRLRLERPIGVRKALYFSSQGAHAEPFFNQVPVDTRGLIV